MHEKKKQQQPVVIRVAGLKKSFRVFIDKSQTLKERIIYWKRGKYSVHNVLKGIDLEIRKGETVALIGQNGCGKSTFLKLLTGIMYPDAGTISIKGKVSSLLELGAGFHPDFSGRENIYNNASIFGLSKKQIDQRYDRIVAFSELEEYIDNPVRTYSSGMYMRLAFSVAINVNADVLLIDEILAVGDANFQKKCMDMIRHLKRQGITIVIVTHDMGAVERICDRAVWLVDGFIRKQGKPREIIDDYLMNMDEKADVIARKEIEREKAEGIAAQEQHAAQEKHAAQEQQSDSVVSVEETAPAQTETEVPKEGKTGLLEYNEDGEKCRWGNGDILISNVEFLDNDDKPTSLVLSGTKITICIHYEVRNEVENLAFGIAVKNVAGDFCIATNSDLRHVPIELPTIGEKGILKIHIDHFDLAKGSYTLDVAAHSLEGLPYDYQQDMYSFIVSNMFSDTGIYAPRMMFKVTKEALK